jgi:protein-disulfide isomerase
VDVALGRRLGVHSTPTFFLDGVKLPDTSPRTFELALQYQVEQRSGGAGVTARREGGSGAR